MKIKKPSKLNVHPEHKTKETYHGHGWGDSGALNSTSSGMQRTKRNRLSSFDKIKPLDQPVSVKAATVEKVSKSGQTLVQKVPVESMWDDEEILNGRVALRFLRDCIRASGKRSKIKTLTLIDALNADESMPWYAYQTGKPIGTYHFSELLKRFDIHSADIRFKGRVHKGFRIESFRQALRRIQLLLASKTGGSKN